MAFVLMLVVVYMNAVSGVPDPLDGPSSDGARSLEASMNMAVS
jgi:hypothetical protein